MNPALVNHLWQSTLCAMGAGLLTLLLRNNRAATRYCVWLAGSLKFLIPFSALISGGQYLARYINAQPHRVGIAVEQVSQPLVLFVAPALAPTAPLEFRDLPLSIWLLAAWACGCALLLVRWAHRWNHVRGMVGKATHVDLGTPISVKSTRSLLEPGVFGIFRPVLMIPEGIFGRLTLEQWNAILAHEWAHVRRRDNLTAALHMFVECVFWFHPLVWWIGAHLVEERERACDEAVFSQGHQPEAYAEGILQVCKSYVETPLPCMAGVTGSDLKKRIERIMTPQALRRLHVGKKALLAMAGVVAVLTPLGMGVLNAPYVEAAPQAAPESRPSFEVASVKPNNSGQFMIAIRSAPGGRWTVTNVPLRNIILFAYRLKDSQLSGGPAWINNERWDITAKAEGNPKPDEYYPMVQRLLEERFQLKFHRERKDLPVYALVVSKPGKLHEAEGECGPPPSTPPPLPEPGKAPTPPCGGMFMSPGRIGGQRVNMTQIADALSRLSGRLVVDQTGLTGRYDLNLEWTPDPGQFPPPPGGGPVGGPGPGGLPPGVPAPPPVDPNGPSLSTALQEQLGLKLESQKGPVEILVIDRVEHPSEN